LSEVSFLNFFLIKNFNLKNFHKNFNFKLIYIKKKYFDNNIFFDFLNFKNKAMLNTLFLGKTKYINSLFKQDQFKINNIFINIFNKYQLYYPKNRKNIKEKLDNFYNFLSFCFKTNKYINLINVKTKLQKYY
jgi:hypothetical protein